MLASGQPIDDPLPAVAAYLDWRRFGQLPAPLLEFDLEIATELRWLADTLEPSSLRAALEGAV